MCMRTQRHGRQHRDAREMMQTKRMAILLSVTLSTITVTHPSVVCRYILPLYSDKLDCSEIGMGPCDRHGDHVIGMGTM